jgi:folate-binding protein YgfZ
MTVLQSTPDRPVSGLPRLAIPVRLTDRSVLALEGPDAAGFLHNLVSANIEVLEVGGAAHTALLSPQGKILFDFCVVRHEGGFLIDVDAASATALQKRLSMYKLRAQVTVSARTDLAVVALGSGGAFPGEDGIVFVDPRLAGMGARAIVPAAHATTTEGERDYERLRIALAIPAFGRDFASGDVVPHDVNYDQFATVDFRKGCYIGQEIVSRMKHRNTARKRLIHVAASDGGALALPPAGTVIKADFREIGTMGSSLDGAGLAIVRLDWAKHAMETGVAITADGVALTLSLPAYATFGWPSDAAD